MFTGIIETLGKVVGIEAEGSNMHLSIETPLADALKIDQSVAHNGVCLTVVKKSPLQYTVTAIAETLEKTSLNHFRVGQLINLERAMILGSRLDGHIVQGHVDCVGTVDEIHDLDGSWMIFIAHPQDAGITVNKGSICVNGISLTVVDSFPDAFSVAIIPYTWEHTNLSKLKTGDAVNLEFDILGKYLKKFSVSLQISKK
jgi:riboflavin synthase